MNDDRPIHIHTPDDMAKMRVAGRLAAEVLDAVAHMVQPGVTTGELNDFCHEMIVSADAIPAPLGYRGFPKSICTSVNQVICHGIPDDTVLESGDIVTVDVTAFLDGVHGDNKEHKKIFRERKRRLCPPTEGLLCSIKVSLRVIQP